MIFDDGDGGGDGDDGDGDDYGGEYVEDYDVDPDDVLLRLLSNIHGTWKSPS